MYTYLCILLLDILPQGMKIEVPNPVADLYTFYGRIEIPGHNSLPLTTDNLMLRGSRVRNTEWAIGCAVYTGKWMIWSKEKTDKTLSLLSRLQGSTNTILEVWINVLTIYLPHIPYKIRKLNIQNSITGEDTKLALNSKYAGNKFSSCERAVNGFLGLFILLLILEMVGSLVAKIFWESRHTGHDVYLGPGNRYLNFNPLSIRIQSIILGQTLFRSSILIIIIIINKLSLNRIKSFRFFFFN